jgi:hypothetical protein
VLVQYGFMQLCDYRTLEEKTYAAIRATNKRTHTLLQGWIVWDRQEEDLATTTAMRQRAGRRELEIALHVVCSLYETLSTCKEIFPVISEIQSDSPHYASQLIEINL